MEVTILSRRRFNEALLATLPASPSEMESLNGLASSEAAGFPRHLVSRGLLTPEGLLRAYQEILRHPRIPARSRRGHRLPPTPCRSPSCARNP